MTSLFKISLFSALQSVLSSCPLLYDDNILVQTVFGTGRATTTDSPGLHGEINTPTDSIFDSTENYLYLTDQNGGGLIRKLAVTVLPIATNVIATPYASKTVFTAINFDYPQFLALGSSVLYVSSAADNIRGLQLSQELSLTYIGNSVLSGSLGGTTCHISSINPGIPRCDGNIEGTGTYARYATISGLALQSSNGIDKVLYIADQNNNKIRSLELTSGKYVLTTFASNVDALFSLQGLALSNNKLFCGVVGGILSYNILSGPSSKSVYAGNPGLQSALTGCHPDGALTAHAKFGYPNYVAVDRSGTLYVSDHNNTGIDSVRRIASFNTLNVTTIAGGTVCYPSPSTLDTSNWCFTPGAPSLSGRKTQFNYNTGLAVANAGNVIFVADTVDNIVRRIYCTPGYNLTFGQCVTSSSTPTQAPSLNPTLSPTIAPTAAPTFSPSFIPSRHPTTRPSYIPSRCPTSRPTNSPSFLPSKYPTFSPTFVPSNIPSLKPTPSPTKSPSYPPTISPTIVPTALPTRPPTTLPTLKPSLSPTSIPSTQPTQSPSKSPTTIPTIAPTTFCNNPQHTGYAQYPYAPNALYQRWMDVSLEAGKLGFFAESPGIGASASFNGALGIALDRTEQIAYVTSADGKKLRRINLLTHYVGSDFTGNHGWHYPMGLVVDHSNRYLYVSDRHVISRVTITSNLSAYSLSVTDICGNIKFGFVNGNGTATKLYEPRFIAIDNTDNNLYISDVLNYAIRRVDLRSANYDVTTLAVFSGKETNGIALDAANTYLYAAATALNGLWKIPLPAASALSTTVSSSLFQFLTNPSSSKGQLVDGPLSSSLWYQPAALTIDGADNLYVMDQWMSGSKPLMYFNYAIRRVSLSAGAVSTVAGKFCINTRASIRAPDPSSICYSDGNSTQAGISKVQAYTVSAYLAVGSRGDKFYFTDYGNNVVRKINCLENSFSYNMTFGQCPCFNMFAVLSE